MTDDEWDMLCENVETTELLTAIDVLDQVRYSLASKADNSPPAIRDDLDKLHQIAMEVVNLGLRDKAGDMFVMAEGIEMHVSDLIEKLESIKRTLARLSDYYPESLLEEAGK